MPLKDLRTPRQVAWQRIGPFPGRGRRRAGRAAALGGEEGQAGQHSLAVWDGARGAVAGRAWRIERAWSRDLMGGGIDLEFLSLLGRHAVICQRAGCADWLSWGIGQRRELRELFVALGGEAGGFPPGFAKAVRVAALSARLEDSEQVRSVSGPARAS